MSGLDSLRGHIRQGQWPSREFRSEEFSGTKDNGGESSAGGIPEECETTTEGDINTLVGADKPGLEPLEVRLQEGAEEG